jgi:hypothetical protein
MAVGLRGFRSKVDMRGVNNIALDVPPGSVTGDMMYAFLGNIAFAPTTVTTPSGWTKLGEWNNPGTDNTTSYLFAKPAGAAEPATYTWTFGHNGKSLGAIGTYTGVDLTAQHRSLVAGWVDGSAPYPSPSVELSTGDWLVTWAFGRQSPATTATKSWVNSTATDAERADEFTDETSSRHCSHAYYDSNGGLPAGNYSRSVTPTPVLQQVHLWSLRIPAAAGSGGGGDPPPTSGTWSAVGIPIR